MVSYATYIYYTRKTLGKILWFYFFVLFCPNDNIYVWDFLTSPYIAVQYYREHSFAQFKINVRPVIIVLKNIAFHVLLLLLKISDL